MTTFTVHGIQNIKIVVDKSKSSLTGKYFYTTTIKASDKDFNDIEITFFSDEPLNKDMIIEDLTNE